MSLFQLPLIEINGVRYMSPKAAAGIWVGLTWQKIVAECKAGKVLGATKDSSNKWIIPADAKRPLDNLEIRKILISLLWLKNKPGTVVEEVQREQLLEVLDYLRDTGFIEPYSSENGISLIGLTLTDKGMHLATEGKKTGIDWVNAGITLVQVLGSIASIWGVVPH